MKREINCYLCPQKATIGNYGKIHCEHCTWYTVTTGAKRYYLKRPDKKKLLDDMDKAKLSDYVQKHYDDEKGVPVQITIKVIKAVTGKISINIRYV